MSTARVCQREHRLGELNYSTRPLSNQEQQPSPEGVVSTKLCCAVWDGLKCTEVAANGKGYCEHHNCMVQSRMLRQVEIYVARKDPREELKQMRGEDDHRGSITLSRHR